MRNPYKRTDVFTCHENSHAKFGHRVSVHHVMCVKKCYPQGCFFFKWFCDLLNKGKSCSRGYHHVGRLCEGCAHYTDTREHLQPDVRLSAAEFERFKNELEDFEDWLATVQDRDVSFWAAVEAVKPQFKKYFYAHHGQIHLDGYILIFTQGYIGTIPLQDVFYGSVSPRQQERLSLAAGDRFEAMGRLVLNRGRLLMSRIWSVDFEQRSGAETWSNSRALVARQTATEFDIQPESCLHCPSGALVDVLVRRNAGDPHRALYCLDGCKNPAECTRSAVAKMFSLTGCGNTH